MVRTVSNVEDEEAHDSSSPIESKRVDKKVNALRSKHSETEQRRRSKINERFQILRDLIPENDQKRDKASFLLEVIQYIQFLQEKLQMYEGSCQGWSPEPTEFSQWRINSGPVESFSDQSQIDRTLFSHDDNVVVHPTLLNNAQNSIESHLNGAALYKPTDNQPMATKALPMKMSVQATMFEGVPGQHHQESFPDAEQLTQQPLSNFWTWRSCRDDCSVPICAANEEELKSESGEASISNAYSQGLLHSLTNALQSSGVDLSQARISVQLDIGKRANEGSSNTSFSAKDCENASGLDYGAPMNIGANYGHPHKRFKHDQT